MDALGERLMGARLDTIEQKLDWIIAAMQPPIIAIKSPYPSSIEEVGMTSLLVGGEVERCYLVVEPPAPLDQEDDDGKD